MEKVPLGGLLANVKIIRICKTRAYELSCFPVFCFTALLRKICRTISLRKLLSQLILRRCQKTTSVLEKQDIKQCCL